MRMRAFITDAVCKTSFELNSVHEINYENEITVFNILLFTYTCVSAERWHILHTVPCSSVQLNLVARYGQQSKLCFFEIEVVVLLRNN